MSFLDELFRLCIVRLKGAQMTGLLYFVFRTVLCQVLSGCFVLCFYCSFVCVVFNYAICYIPFLFPLFCCYKKLRCVCVVF